jgi:class 3 adenylate cyclase/predicted ATPase
MDPEDVREIIVAYHRWVADTIARFDGFVAKYMGDGVLVYFGYPRAHEDDVERAIRAGLALVDTVGSLQAPAPLRVRVGIATGLVVVGDLISSGEGQERGVVGETPNLAARLQALAEPDTVVIGPRTRRLLGSLFEYRDLGAVEVKGLPEPVHAHQVVRESAIQSRFEALHGATLTPLVGREEEIGLLLRQWNRAKSGEGRVVLLSGEPGIGKSRLTAALQERIKNEPHIRWRYFCSAHHEDSALHPVIAQLERTAGFEHEDTPEGKLDKLATVLAAASPEDEALLADLLSLPTEGRFPPLQLTPQRQKEKTFEALLRHLEGLAQQRPVLMLFEDVHWIDPSSRELLDLIIGWLPRLPVLLLVTFRPEFQPPWSGQAHVRVLVLNRLDRREGAALVQGVVGTGALPGEVVAEIVERTDGVPLFVEELAKAVLEGGNTGTTLSRAGATAFNVPATLHASLMARLDRLGSAAKEVAQVGSALGREFSYELLAAVAQRSATELNAALDQLVGAGLVFRQGALPHASFLFKHALVQDAAYSTLLRGRRQELHTQTAQALAAHYPELVESQPELFAHHYAEAGLVEKSVTFWAKAGHGSAARSAMPEAAAQFQKGLDQLALLSGNPERQRQELEFRCALGAVLTTTKGSAAPETGRAYARARELWAQLGFPSEFLRVPSGQARYHLFRGELDLAQRVDEDLLRLSRERNDPAGLVLGHLSSGRTLLYSGKFAVARSHLEAGLALYDPIAHYSLVQQVALHPAVVSQSYLGNILFCLGFPDQGLARSSAAIVEARSLAHPPTLATSLILSAVPLSLIGDILSLDERIDELLAVAAEHGFSYWHAVGTIFRGWAKVKRGDLTGGILLLRRGLSDYRATDAQVWVPYCLALLGRGCAMAGQIEESSTMLDEALQIAEGTGERWLAAELNRHKGHLLWRQEHPEAAEEFYRKALSIAEVQEARFFELRASTSLARLWREQGKRDAARDLLSPVYGWFTEGFDTPVLKQAKALLDEL